MKSLFYRTFAKLTGKNSHATPPDVIKDQLFESRPLPMGRKEFEAWADRIIGGALVSADRESQRMALTSMIMHLGPTEDHKPDAFFIHQLRKSAANQVAHAIFVEIQEAKKARIAAEKDAEDKLANRDTSKVLPFEAKAEVLGN